MTDRPWMKFYPSDWRGSTSLKLVSMGARGLWIEMICIMHEAEPYGHLVHRGRALEAKGLAAMVGAPVQDVEVWLVELEDNGVFERKRNQVIFSLRMERDEQKRRIGRETGKKGGNPKLLNQRGNETTLKGQDNPAENGPSNTQRPEARDQRPEREGAEPALPDLFLLEGPKPEAPVDAAHRLYNEMAKRVGAARADPLTDARRRSLAARLNGEGLPRWIRALDQVERSSFLCGERAAVPGRSKFKLDLAFLLQPEKFQKVVEGGYGDDRVPQARADEGPETWSATRWDRVLSKWKHSGRWNDEAGPKPNEPGYLGPKEI